MSLSKKGNTTLIEIIFTEGESGHKCSFHYPSFNNILHGLRESTCNHGQVAPTLGKHLFPTKIEDWNVIFSPPFDPRRFEHAPHRTHLSPARLCRQGEVHRPPQHLLANGRGTEGPKVSIQNGVWVTGYMPLRNCFERAVGTRYKANFLKEKKVRMVKSAQPI